MKQLSGLDSAFIAFERPHAPQHLGTLLVYDQSTAPGGLVRFKDILAFIESRLHIADVLRRRLVKTPLNLDYPYWIEDPDFDLEYHVRHIALPKPGDWRQLCIQAARLFSRPLDLTRPPWEVTVIEGLDNVDGVAEGSYAMLVKFHHAAVDGQGSLQIMMALHDLPEEVVAAYEHRKADWQPEKEPEPLELLSKAYAKLGESDPFKQLLSSGNLLPDLMKLQQPGESVQAAAPGAPETRFNQGVSSSRVFDSAIMTFDGIKAIRKLVPGCKVNDVFLSIVAGGLRGYLAAKGELPDASMTAAVPISVRAEADIDSGGNEVTGMTVPVGTHIAEASERLAFVHAQTVKHKAMTEAVGAKKLVEQSKSSPMFNLGLASSLLIDMGGIKQQRMINTVVTNVPGAPEPNYSMGARLVRSFGMICLVDGVGLGHTVSTYCDMATITFVACRKILPDPEFYTQCLLESYRDHLAASEKAA